MTMLDFQSYSPARKTIKLFMPLKHAIRFLALFMCATLLSTQSHANPSGGPYIYLTDYYNTSSPNTNNGLTPWLNTIATSHQCGYVPAGTYYVPNPLTIDMSTNSNQTKGICILGDGVQNSVLVSTTASSSQTACFLLEASGGSTALPAAAFYPDIERIGFSCPASGTALMIGQENFSDQINNGKIDVYAASSSTANSANALEVNSVFNMRISGTFNNTPHNGDACRIREGEFSNFFLSCGNSATALHLTNGYNIGNVFTSPDFEEVNVDIDIDNATTVNNTFVGGQYVTDGNPGSTYISASNGSSNRLLNPNIATNFTSNGLTGIVLDVNDGTPTISSGGGTGAYIIGDDRAGNVRLGSGSGSSITISFNRSYGTVPRCVATSQNGIPIQYNMTTSSLSVSSIGGQSLDNSNVQYDCSRP